ncbi:DUF1800 domain-containing protein [Segnochrobactraceae bacterium EtOH-i3]
MEQTRDADRATVIALTRFGLGPRPGDIERVRADPVGAVRADLAEATLDLPTSAGLPDVEAALGASRETRRWRRDMVQVVADLDLLRQVSNPGTDAAASPDPAVMFARLGPSAPDGEDPGTGMVDVLYAPTLLSDEIDARIDRYLAAPVGFAERLVLFWSNHFAVGLKRDDLQVSVGALEREAIRPNVRGSFAGMLLAVARHPGMLLYLDNDQSFGPNSPVGQKTGRGLNENLARELLELHTLGVDGGYTQADVTSLACIITGWTISDRRGQGGFQFVPARHEPGPQTVLGQEFPAGGVEQGEAALVALTRHPATARHIARKLASYFVADDPPPALVDRLARVFRETDGDLGAVSRALVEAPEAWAAGPAKVRPPQEFLIAMMRLVGRQLRASEFVSLSTTLGQPYWNAPAPNGFPTTSDAWISPKGMMDRVAVASRIAARIPGNTEPAALLAAAFGDTVSESTTRAVMSAESRNQAVAILLMAPEFQWR